MDDRSDRKTTTADSFGRSAEGYRTSKTHSEGTDLETLASWCGGATRALDVATGAGHTAGALLDAGVPNVVASDASPSMVETGVESYPGVRGVVADAERLPFAADSFDAATCRIAAHHFPAAEAFVAEVARVVQTGGTFAFEDNVAPDDDELASFLNRLEAMRDPTHVESHRASTWKQWLVDAGFSVEETVTTTKRLQFDPWVRRSSSLDADDRDAVQQLLLDAPKPAVEYYGIEYDGDGVESFETPKALFRAVR